MASPFGPALLVVDARDKRVIAEMPEIERILHSRGLEYAVEEVREPRRATAIAGAALRGGRRFVVAVGGDRLVHEVVNGMIENDQPITEEPVLGVVAGGADNDFLRTFGLPGDASAASHLPGETTYAIDVGKVSYVDRDGRASVRYFANLAEAGFGADVVSRAGSGGRLGQFLGFWGAVLRFKKAEVKVRAARKEYEGPAYNVVVGNGRFGGGGWRVSPRSFPGDGVLEVLVMRGPKSEMFTMLPQVYRGEQVPSSSIVELRGKDVSIEGDRPLPVQVDGQLVGWTPAAFTTLTKAVLLKI